MPTAAFAAHRDRLETYFDRTARAAWEQLTSDAPVSRIRATVRAGRDEMRALLLSWLPNDLRGKRLLDAGCGTGALAVAAAERGAQVLAVDVSAGLIEVARERAPHGLDLEFRAGDMLDPGLGRFDLVVCMDSLIHYQAKDALAALNGLAARAGDRVLFTFAPSTPALTLMHMAGKLFPRSDRAPAIAPVHEDALRRGLAQAAPWAMVGRTRRVSRGFYTSQAMELARR